MALEGVQPGLISNFCSSVYELGVKGWANAGHYKTEFLANETVQKGIDLGNKHIVDNAVKNWPQALKYEWSTTNSFITGSIVAAFALALIGSFIGPAKGND